MIKLSIIVPVYNMAADGKLEYCLDSLVNQTMAPGSYEIIAVDDCSTDNSLEILRSYQDRYPDRFIAIASDRNRHQGGAKNIGLAGAKGEWIGFIDAAEDFAAHRLSNAATSERLLLHMGDGATPFGIPAVLCLFWRRRR